MLDYVRLIRQFGARAQRVSRPPFTFERIRWAWGVVQQRGPSQIDKAHGALSFLRGAEAFFDLPPLIGLAFEPELSLAQVPREPSFQTVNLRVLSALRGALGAAPLVETPPEVQAWAGKLLRFVEVRLSELRNRALQQAGSLEEGRTLLLMLAVFLADVYAAGMDMRFLNAALKLRDLSWLGPSLEFDEALRSHGRPLLVSHLQLRLHLALERSLADLNRNDETNRHL